MDATRRAVSALQLVIAVPLGVLVAIPLAVVVALIFHLQVLLHLLRFLGRGAAQLVTRLLGERIALMSGETAPPTLALPRRE
jgi:hypothetical protein